MSRKNEGQSILKWMAYITLVKNSAELDGHDDGESDS